MQPRSDVSPTNFNAPLSASPFSAPKGLGRWRLQRTVIAAALLVTVVALVVAAMFWAATRERNNSAFASLENEASLVAHMADRTGAKSLAAILSDLSGVPSPDQPGRIQPEGTQRTLFAIYDSDDRQLAGPRILERRNVSRDGRRQLIRYEPMAKPQGREQAAMPRLALAVTTELRSGGRITALRDTGAAQAFAWRVIGWLVLATLLITALVMTTGALAARATQRRLTALSATIADIMSGDLSRRLTISMRGDEIDRLAADVNVMLERIERLMHGLRDVSDSIAHDLKTPLNRLRARVEAALRKADARPLANSAHALSSGAGGSPAEALVDELRQALTQTIDDADGLIRTFDSLLLVARLEAGAVARRAQPFNVVELLSDVADLYEPLAEERGLSLSLFADLPEKIMVTAHRQLVMQAITNLVENAIKYGTPVCPDRTAATIEIGAHARSHTVEIVVADHGPGIPKDQHARARQRFARLDTSRSTAGSGLGLSLVAAVADLHAGQLELGDNAPGLRAALILPVRPASASAKAAPDNGVPAKG